MTIASLQPIFLFTKTYFDMIRDTGMNDDEPACSYNFCSHTLTGFPYFDFMSSCTGLNHWQYENQCTNSESSLTKTCLMKRFKPSCAWLDIFLSLPNQCATILDERQFLESDELKTFPWTVISLDLTYIRWWHYGLVPINQRIQIHICFL